MLEKLQKVIDVYQIPTIIDSKKNFFENAALIKDVIKQKQLPVSSSFDIQKLEKELQIHQLFFDDDEGKRTIQEFLENGYCLEDNAIVFKDYIPIDVVSYNYNQVKLVNSKKFKRHGFGIREITIRIFTPHFGRFKFTLTDQLSVFFNWRHIPRP